MFFLSNFIEAFHVSFFIIFLILKICLMADWGSKFIWQMLRVDIFTSLKPTNNYIQVKWVHTLWIKAHNFFKKMFLYFFEAFSMESDFRLTKTLKRKEVFVILKKPCVFVRDIFLLTHWKIESWHFLNVLCWRIYVNKKLTFLLTASISHFFECFFILLFCCYEASFDKYINSWTNYYFWQ